MKPDVVYPGLLLCAVLGLPVALELWASGASSKVSHPGVAATGNAPPAATHCEPSSSVPNHVRTPRLLGRVDTVRIDLEGILTGPGSEESVTVSPCTTTRGLGPGRDCMIAGRQSDN